MASPRWSTPHRSISPRILHVVLFVSIAAKFAVASVVFEPSDSDRERPSDPPPVATVGGGLHHDVSMACSGCAAVVHTLKRLTDRPPVGKRGVVVTEVDPVTGDEVQVPYRDSRQFKDDALSRTCSPPSLTTWTRKKTWLGDTTWRPDDLPWNHDAAEQPIDEDLKAICNAVIDKYKHQMLAAVEAGDPSRVCRSLGCGTVPAVHEAFIETTEKFTKDPAIVLKLAPVFLVALVLPSLFRPMFAPPVSPGDINDELNAVRSARVNARTGVTNGGDTGGKRKGRKQIGRGR